MVTKERFFLGAFYLLCVTGVFGTLTLDFFFCSLVPNFVKVLDQSSGAQVFKFPGVSCSLPDVLLIRFIGVLG